MTSHYPRKSFCMGEAGELVQVAGHAFELGHEIQMFAAQTLAHTTDSYQLPENFRARPSGSTCQCLKSQFMLRVDGGLCGIPVFGLCPAAGVRPYVWGVSWIRLFVLDRRDESREASFWLTKTQTCLTNR